VRNPLVLHTLPADRFPGSTGALHELLSDTDLLDLLGQALGPPALTQATWVHSTDGTALHHDPHPFEPGAPILGVWIALENITPGAGPFVVVPGSLDLDPAAPDVVAWRQAAARAAHAQFHARTDPTGAAGARAAERLSQVLHARDLHPEPLLPRAGDVLLWRGDLVHGSRAPDPGPQTRQSLLLHVVEQRFAAG